MIFELTRPRREEPGQRPRRWTGGSRSDTTTTLRQLPRKTRIIIETSSDDTTASRSTPDMAALTKTDWSKSILISTPSGAAALMAGSASRAASTTARVEAFDFLRMAR